MKGKKTWKRWLCAMVAVALLSTLPGTAFGAEKPEWYYEDSILVYVEVDESRTFSPEDFPVIDCKKVFVLGKEQLEDEEKVMYLLVLMRNSPQKTSLKEDIEKLRTLPMVTNAERNDRFVAEEPDRLTLVPYCCYLAKGETIEISIGKRDWVNFQWIYGIKFRPDSAGFNMDNLQTDSFSEYGVSRFWPDSQQPGGEQILRPDSRPEDLEAKKSENGWYYGLAGEANENLFDTVARLSAVPEILSVSIASLNARGKSFYTGYKNMPVLSLNKGEAVSEKIRDQYWSISNTKVVDCKLNTFEDKDGLTDSKLTVQGLKSGMSKINVEERYFDTYTTASCIIIVYEPGNVYSPGDVNRDGRVDEDDALCVLKYSVGLIELYVHEDVADLNMDEVVDARDALLMLKIAVGIL